MSIVVDLKSRCAGVPRDMRPALNLLIAIATVAGSAQTGGQRGLSALADRVTTLTRDSGWKRVASVRIAFRTFHPQGMVKIGETFFVSSVEVKDRAAGVG